jgi:hypothetical protein
MVSLQVHTPTSERKFRVVVTKDLPGDRWLQMLLKSGCQVDICKHSDTILSQDTIKTLIAADETHGVLGQLTEVCGISTASNLPACSRLHLSVELQAPEPFRQPRHYSILHDKPFADCSNGTAHCLKHCPRQVALYTATML